MIGQPAVDAAFVGEKLSVSATAARRAIDQAVTAGILAETSDRKRNRVWIAGEVIALLDEFSDRAGRRGCLHQKVGVEALWISPRLVAAAAFALIWAWFSHLST